MDNKMMYDFAVRQVEWYEKQTAFCRNQIERCNKWLKDERKQDKELAEYALKTDPDDELTQRVFGGKYVGTETRKLMNERAKYYREIKKNDARIQHYKKEAEYYGARLDTRL